MTDLNCGFGNQRRGKRGEPSGSTELRRGLARIEAQGIQSETGRPLARDAGRRVSEIELRHVCPGNTKADEEAKTLRELVKLSWRPGDGDSWNAVLALDPRHHVSRLFICAIGVLAESRSIYPLTKWCCWDTGEDQI